MNKIEKSFIGFLLLMPFIFVISLGMINSAFLKVQEKEVVVEGKYEALPHSLMVNVFNGKYHTKKVAEIPTEYFLNVRINKDLHLIQTTKEIYEGIEKKDKIKVNIIQQRISNKIHVQDLGIKRISNEQLANKQEEVRRMVEEQFKNKD